MKKCITIFSLLACFLLLSPIKISAEETNPPLPCSEVEKYGQIDRNLRIYVDETDNPLNCVFVDRVDALENYKKANSSFINTITSTYQLGELNKDSLAEYVEKVNESSVRAVGFNNEILELNIFFDVYGNNEKNEKIIEFVSRRYNGYLTLDEINEILPLMPEYSTLYSKYGGSVKGAKDEASASLEGIDSHSVTAPSGKSIDQFIDDVIGAVKIVFRIIGTFLKGIAGVLLKGST